jgi:short subunit dehydrogenase-like uncharacterized protein
MAKPEFDVILWGATGFTGQLVAQHLAQHYAEGLRWALAGRNQAKLQQVREEIGLPELPLLQADSADRTSLDRLANRSRVICTTVGPYARYGSELVAACVAAGTHYCDLTGEVPWMARMIEQHQQAAESSGARIVHCCGFDSIPTDLGVHFLQGAMRETHGEVANRAKSRIGQFSGAASGGTIASMMQMMEEARRDASVRRILLEPYSLNPAPLQHGPDGPDSTRVAFDEDFEQWTAPFVMAAINARVVRRSNALADFPYGRDFRFDERQLTGAGRAGKRRAQKIAAGLKLTVGVMAFGPGRKLAARFLPSPGEGPTPEQQRKGHFELFVHGLNSISGKTLTTRVSGDRDPGYGATSRMLGEAAVCLARDKLDVGGGLWTPATAMGDQLITRLQERAGMTFELLSQD